MDENKQENQPVKKEKRKLPWGYLLLAVLPCISFFVFPAFSLYYKNTGDFAFGASTIITYALTGCAAVFIILSVIAFLLPQKKGLWIFSSLTFSAGFGLYIQYNFLNPKVGTLDGTMIDWSAYTKNGVISLAFWLVCIIVPLVLTLKWKEKCLTVLKLLSVCVAGIEVATVVTLMLTTPKATQSAFSVTNANRLNVSDENIVVFVLDTVDEELFRQLRADGNPEVSDEALTDFISFNNCISGGSPTLFGLPILLTGQQYEETKETDGDYLAEVYNSYLADAFGNCALYQDLHDNGYQIGIYTDAMYLQGCPEDLLDNLGYGQWSISNKTGFAKTLYKFCAFLTFPQQLKQYFWGYTAEFNQWMTLKKYDGSVYNWSTGNDVSYYKELTQDGLNYTQGEKNFRFYHFTGAHSYDLNENMQFEKNSTPTRQTRGEFMMVETYIQQLKDLGVYDNTTIVITADHGDRHDQVYAQPTVLIKPRNYHGAFSENNAPIQFMQFPATLASEFLSDYSSYGPGYFDIQQNTEIDRTQIVHRPLLENGDVIHGYNPTKSAIEFIFHGNANDNNFDLVDKAAN